MHALRVMDRSTSASFHKNPFAGQWADRTHSLSWQARSGFLVARNSLIPGRLRLNSHPMERTASRVPRFFVSSPLFSGTEIDLPAPAARHCTALRLHRGSPVTLFDGRGGEFLAELTLISREGARARVDARRTVDLESPLFILLAQCLSSGDRMDITLQKSTELGVAVFAPISSERSVVRLAPERVDRRIAHWRNVAVAACEQCGRNRVPEVASLRDIDSFLVDAETPGLRLMLAPGAKQRLKDLEPPRSVTLLVGPEGGLTPTEKRTAERSGFVPVALGPRVLRTETAPIAAIAAMQALWGDG